MTFTRCRIYESERFLVTAIFVIAITTAIAATAFVAAVATAATFIVTAAAAAAVAATTVATAAITTATAIATIAAAAAAFVITAASTIAGRTAAAMIFFGFFHDQLFFAKGNVFEVLNGIQCVLFVLHFHKTKPTAFAGFSIQRHFSGNQGTKFFKNLH